MNIFWCMNFVALWAFKNSTPELLCCKVAVVVTEKEHGPQKYFSMGNLENCKVITHIGSYWGKR